MAAKCVLLVGEVCVDFTLATHSSPVKMRLGGIVHAARGLWACGTPYSVAAVCPEYLVADAETYLKRHGCHEFIRLGDVKGAPNVIIIGDVQEVGHQGYESLLRDSKVVTLRELSDHLKYYTTAVVFPGQYDVAAIAASLSEDVKITIDVAYDVGSFDSLIPLIGRVYAITISTSSRLSMSIAAEDPSALIDACRVLGADFLLLKENRGGSRLFNLETSEVEHIPAVLGETANSVGVGDVYTAVFAAYPAPTRCEAAWRGMQVATQYSGTTYPDDLAQNVRRELSLSIENVTALGGTLLPWHVRRKLPIYLAAPDFSYISKPEIERAVEALEYHNFVVRRPVIENGEAARTTNPSALRRFYIQDISLLDECVAVFAVPLARDAGTLIEVGMAIAKGMPVVTFDPRHENENTMVICGSKVYSDDLDICLNATFDALATIWAKRQ